MNWSNSNNLSYSYRCIKLRVKQMWWPLHYGTMLLPRGNSTLSLISILVKSFTECQTLYRDLHCQKRWSAIFCISTTKWRVLFQVHQKLRPLVDLSHDDNNIQKAICVPRMTNPKEFNNPLTFQLRPLLVRCPLMSSLSESRAHLKVSETLWMT